MRIYGRTTLDAGKILFQIRHLLGVTFGFYLSHNGDRLNRRYLRRDARRHLGLEDEQIDAGREDRAMRSGDSRKEDMRDRKE